MSDTEDLAALNDRLMAKNHALAEALSRAGKELTKRSHSSPSSLSRRSPSPPWSRSIPPHR